MDCLYTQIALEQVLLLYLNTKQILLFACQNMLFIFSKVHSQSSMFIQLHKLYKCQCYSSYKIVHNSFKVTSNKIHTYIQFNVQVQSAVHLVVPSSCSQSEFPFFHFQYIAFRQ